MIICQPHLEMLGLNTHKFIHDEHDGSQRDWYQSCGIIFLKYWKPVKSRFKIHNGGYPRELQWFWKEKKDGIEGTNCVLYDESCPALQ
uniref:Uncharacterized protein n=1 Tax=Romanomermis culicivorax TaxID=13658 RepID=A0A915IY56_ROMCU